ncbi:MAG: hypothetical protein ABS95_01415 [Verrucomicrobia bacterium SCN 57-15]|nr:MAG: hypothetical protein ABS95_01415 [Verrucomicrobia bacterium SCN 57-15]
MLRKLIVFLLLIAILFIAPWAFIRTLQGSTPDQPEVGTTRMAVGWDYEDWGSITGFRVYLSQSNAPIRFVDVATNRLDLTNIMYQLPNGVYELHATAVGLSELESLPSNSIWLFWYGQPPKAPTNFVIQFLK